MIVITDIAKLNSSSSIFNEIKMETLAQTYSTLINSRRIFEFIPEKELGIFEGNVYTNLSLSMGKGIASTNATNSNTLVNDDEINVKLVTIKTLIIKAKIKSVTKHLPKIEIE